MASRREAMATTTRAFCIRHSRRRATRISHGNVARLAAREGEENLGVICRKIAADETRHETFYTRVIGAIMDQDPEGGVLTYRTMLRSLIAMPGSRMTDGSDPHLFDKYAAITQRIGVYTYRDYGAIIGHLNDTWRIADRSLSGKAAKAQDYICKQPERLRVPRGRTARADPQPSTRGLLLVARPPELSERWRTRYLGSKPARIVPSRPIKGCGWGTRPSGRQPGPRPSSAEVGARSVRRGPEGGRPLRIAAATSVDSPMSESRLIAVPRLQMQLPGAGADGVQLHSPGSSRRPRGASRHRARRPGAARCRGRRSCDRSERLAAGQLHERRQDVHHRGDRAVLVPAGIVPGHQAIVQTRMPPSNVCPLPPRRGWLFAP